MKFHVAALLLVTASVSHGFVPTTPKTNTKSTPCRISMSAVEEESATAASTAASNITGKASASLTNDIISKLRYRELQRELEARDLDTTGAIGTMRDRLRDAAIAQQDMIAQEFGKVKVQQQSKDRIIDEQALNDAFQNSGINFIDTADPDFDYKSLVRDIRRASEKRHWKSATRKLKKLSRRFQDRAIEQEVYEMVLSSCTPARLQGARAAEPARKIIESMIDVGFVVSADTINYCIKNSIGEGPSGTHEGHGGIDTALAIMAATDRMVENMKSTTTDSESSNDMLAATSGNIIQLETYEKVITALAEEQSVDDALEMFRSLVVEKSETPSLMLFADVAMAAVDRGDAKEAEKVLTLLAYAKASGYDLDNIASTVDGRRLLAAGVIAAERMDNIPLGLRLLASASKAKGCEPDRGDDLVASSSSAAQRSATILHRRAINKAVEDSSWKLAVKLMGLMMERTLKPSPSVWRNVVTCCARAEKSRKATGLLLDWAKLAQAGSAEKPPLRVFNTVINACEICGEEELTLQVLDKMRETHETDGNLITFNIAIKRLAKQGNKRACEGIIVGMLQNNIEPSVVSYTTAIASCVTSEPKDSALAYEWLTRMRSRMVQPNVVTYNTALAACLDGTYGSTLRASKIAAEMYADVEELSEKGISADALDQYTSVIPNLYTKTLARQLMKQLKTNWEDDDAVDKSTAKATIRPLFLKLVEFQKTETAEKAIQKEADATAVRRSKEEDSVTTTKRDEEALEFSEAVMTHRLAEV